MRYASGHKEQTRHLILEAASRVFRRDGFAGASVGKIMGEAGLTVGGFYAHFASKEDLFIQALAGAFSQSVTDFAAGLDDRQDWVAGFVGRYLSEEHRLDIEHGCPMSALSAEVARAEGPIRQGFGSHLEEFLQLLSNQLGQPDDQPTDRALVITALCVGAMSLARATGDVQLAGRILSAGRDAVQVLGQ
ncbi:MAG: TetR/AcrR family transcriptional regulator [Nocardioidaceae bacterium]